MPTTNAQTNDWQTLQRRLERLKRRQQLIASKVEDLKERLHHLSRMYKETHA